MDGHDLWQDDHLNRRIFAEHFQDLLLARYAARQNYIVNLDASWGSGKTYFLTNLAEQLRNAGYPVAYINAWEDDRSDDPLVSVLAAIDHTISEMVVGKEAIVEKLKAAKKRLAPVVAEVTKQVGLHALKVGLGISLGKVLEAGNLDDDYEVDEDAIGKGIDATRKEAEKLVQARLDSLRAEKASIEGFRANVADVLQSAELQLPLFVFVDELDRCRPTYAVRMLEELRHIFAIPGVVFVVGTDSVQLSHSIRALYGAEFDSRTYLRRFFDRVVVFPPVSSAQFFQGLMEANGIDTDAAFFSSPDILTMDVFTKLFEVRAYSYRDIEQFFEILETFVASWDEHVKIEPVSLAAHIDDYLSNPRDFPRFAHHTNAVEREKWVLGKGRNSIDLRLLSQTLYRKTTEDLRHLDGTWPLHAYFAQEYNYYVVGKEARQPVFTLLSGYKARVHMSARLTYER